MNLIQQPISKNKYKFIDIPTGNSFECSAKLHPIKSEATEDFEFEVKSEWVNVANEYQYIIDPLKRLLQASRRSGSPILWT